MLNPCEPSLPERTNRLVSNGRDFNQMKSRVSFVFVALMMTFMAANCAEVRETSAVSAWTKLPSLPDREGFAGSFAGSHNGALIVAGGANFPGKRPWEGGAKTWHDSVFVLE